MLILMKDEMLKIVLILFCMYKIWKCIFVLSRYDVIFVLIFIIIFWLFCCDIILVLYMYDIELYIDLF